MLYECKNEFLGIQNDSLIIYIMLYEGTPILSSFYIEKKTLSKHCLNIVSNHWGSNGTLSFFQKT